MTGPNHGRNWPPYAAARPTTAGSLAWPLAPLTMSARSAFLLVPTTAYAPPLRAHVPPRAAAGHAAPPRRQTLLPPDPSRRHGLPHRFLLSCCFNLAAGSIIQRPRLPWIPTWLNLLFSEDSEIQRLSPLLFSRCSKHGWSLMDFVSKHGRWSLMDGPFTPSSRSTQHLPKAGS